jgi:hypothetical protein
MDSVKQLQSKLTTQNLIKYLIEGIAVALAAYYIPNRKSHITEILTIALVASLSFFILDTFSEGVAAGARIGTGFGIGYNLANSASVTLPFF